MELRSTPMIMLVQLRRTSTPAQVRISVACAQRHKLVHRNFWCLPVPYTAHRAGVAGTRSVPAIIPYHALSRLITPYHSVSFLLIPYHARSFLGGSVAPPFVKGGEGGEGEAALGGGGAALPLR